MKKSIFHIALSFLLTLAVTEYLWHTFIVKERVAVELNTGEEQELNEEISESKDLDFRNLPFGSDPAGLFKNFPLGISSDVCLKCGRLSTLLSRHKPLKLFIVYCELRLAC